MNPRKLVEHQVQRVRRRLLLRQLLETLFSFWAVGLLVCAAWYLIQPFMAAQPESWARHGIPAAVMIASTLAALAWSVMRAPRFLAASMALDEEFELQERVTTLSTLSSDQLNSSVGLALLDDVRVYNRALATSEISALAGL